MRKIKHVLDESLDTTVVNTLPFDNNTLIRDELTSEIIRFIEPVDSTVTFGDWRENLPTYDLDHRGGSMTPIKTLTDLSDSYDLFNKLAIFGSDLSSSFINQTNVFWQKKIGGVNEDHVGKITLDEAGNIYLAGFRFSNTVGGDTIYFNDLSVIKLDRLGNIIWQKKIGEIDNTVGFDFALKAIFLAFK